MNASGTVEKTGKAAGNRRGIIIIMVVSILTIVVFIVAAFSTFVYDERRGSKRSLDAVQAEMAAKSGLEQAVSVIDYCASENADGVIFSPALAADAGEYLEKNWPAPYVLNGDGQPEIYDYTTMGNADFAGREAWRRGPSQYFRPGESEAPENYVEILDHELVPYDPYDLEDGGSDSGVWDGNPPPYSGRWFDLSIGDNEGGADVYKTWIENNAEFQYATLSSTPYSMDITENGALRGRFAVLVFELDGALSPAVSCWHGENAAELSATLNPFFDKPDEVKMVLDEMDFQFQGGGSYTGAWWDGLENSGCLFNTDSNACLDSLVPFDSAGNYLKDFGRLDGWSDFWRKIYPAQLEPIVDNEGSENPDKMKYLRQKNALRVMFRPYPLQKEISGGADARPRININIAPWITIRAALGRLGQQGGGYSDIDPNPAFSAEKLDKLTNAIIEARPFFSRPDFEEFLASQLDDSGGSYGRLRELVSRRIIGSPEKKALFCDGGMDGRETYSGQTPNSPADIFLGKRLDWFRNEVFMKFADCKADLSESEINILLNSVSPGDTASFFSPGARLTWHGKTPGEIESLSETDSIAFFDGNLSGTTGKPDLSASSDAWEWSLDPSTTGAYRFAFEREIDIAWYDPSTSMVRKETFTVVDTNGSDSTPEPFRSGDAVPAMEFKFRTRYYYIIVVGQSLIKREDDAEAALRAEKRFEAVYDALERKIVFQREPATDKASLWDPAPASLP